ncbi:MAG: DUF1178 family protein [Actinobacteria bacterium]|nr:DUF1178 family protein [Actinomycetota bacterium]
MSYTWSYSSISLFEQCPRKYYRLRIVKDIVEPVQEHLLYGSAVHKAAEEFIRDGVDLPPKFSQFKSQLVAMRDLVGKSEDVGASFAEEARKIHYKESPERSIRGQTSADEVMALREEGIDVLALPEMPVLKNTLQ